MPNVAFFKSLDNDDEITALKVVKREDIKSRNTQTGDAAIHVAAKKGFGFLTEKLISFGADPYELNPNTRQSAISLAYLNGHNAVVLQILESKAPVSSNIGSFILDTVKGKDFAMTRLACKVAGKDFVKKSLAIWTNQKDETAIHIASFNNDLDTLQLLLEYEIDPYALNEDNENALSIAIANNFTKIVDAILSSSNPVTNNIGTAILDAVKSGNAVLVDRLCVKAGDKFSECFKAWVSKGSNMLQIAVNNNDIAMVKVLLKHNADPFALDEDNENALSMAIANKQTDIINLLLNDINKTKDTNIVSALLTSVLNDDVETTRQMFEKIDPEIIQKITSSWTFGKNKNSLLHKAVTNGNEAMVRLLMSQGSDPQTKNEIGESAIDLAQAAKNDQLYNVLCKKEEVQNVEVICNKKDDEKYLQDLNSAMWLTAEQMVNYGDFIRYLKTANINIDDTQSLGVWDDRKEFYFTDTEKSSLCSEKFLKDFWSDIRNLNATHDSHAQKFEREKQKDSTIQDVSPACIGFVTIALDTPKGVKEICFVVPNNDPRDIGFKSLEKFINNYRQKSKKSIEFVLVGGESKSNVALNIIFESLVKEGEYTRKKCVEKLFIKLFLKLFLEYGNKMKVTGVAARTYYAFYNEIDYGFKSKDPANRIVRPMPSRDFINITDAIYVEAMPCCPECQTNKPSVQTMLIGAQNAGTKKEGPRDLSPLRNSIRSESSLFFRQEASNSNSTNNASSNNNNNSRSFYKPGIVI